MFLKYQLPIQIRYETFLEQYWIFGNSKTINISNLTFYMFAIFVILPMIRFSLSYPHK